MSAPNVLFNVAYALSESEIQSRPFINKKYLKEREFYACKTKDSFIRYVDKGINCGDVIGYTSNEEKSTGIFDNYGILNEKQKTSLKNKLRKTESVIWHCVISFTEEFGDQYMKDTECAYNLLKVELPKFFKNAGFQIDNVIWFAGLHENTDNQHIHLCFFEKEKKYINAKGESRFHYPKISYSAIERFIVDVEKNLTGIDNEFRNYRIDLLKQGAEAISNPTNKIKRKMLELYRKLPLDSRLSYNSLNMQELRPLIKEIIYLIIKTTPSLKSTYLEFTKQLIERDKEIKTICERQKIDDVTPYLIEQKYLTDIERRLANKIIKELLNIKKDENNEMRLVKRSNYKKGVEKRHRKWLFKKSLDFSKDFEEEILYNFNNFRYRLEIAELHRLIEEGVVDVNE